jgi:hypothetical protein
MMRDKERKASSQKSESIKGVLVLLIYVQSVCLPVGDDVNEGRWNRERKEN